MCRPDAIDVRWVQLRVTEDTVDLHKVAVHHKAVDWSTLHHETQVTEGGSVHDEFDGAPYVWHLYYHLGGRTVHSHAFKTDPRVVTGDWLSGNDSLHLTGARTVQSEGYVSVTLPVEATHVTATHPTRRTQRHRLSLHAAPKLVPQQAAGTPEFIPVQQVGDPTRQKNLVFLSGGYTTAERDKFVSDVQRAVSFLLGSSKELPTQPAPWDRYGAVINFFAVFQSSLDSGASFPIGKDGSGGHPQLGEVVKQNNLQCRYGTTVLRLLGCDVGLVQALASHAPSNSERTTAIVLVNDDIYGGSGSFGVGGKSAAVYNGPQMHTVLIHELGHADANLLDEYDYSQTSDLRDPVINCHWSVQQVPWIAWINVPLGVRTPVAICGYSNYYKPTAAHCLMNSGNVNEYCAVCAQGVIDGIYSELLDLATPRCPRYPEVLVITAANEDHYLVANRRFFDGPVPRSAATLKPHTDGTALRVDQGDIVVSWRMPDGTTFDGTMVNPRSYIIINGEKLGVGEHNITLTVIDKTQFVRAPSDLVTQRMTFNTDYRVLVVPVDNATFGHCTSARLSGLTTADAGKNFVNECPSSVASPLAPTNFYCGVCDIGKVCNDSYPIAPIEAPANVGAAVAKIEAFIFGIGGAILFAAICLFIVLTLWLARRSGKEVHEVVPYPKWVERLRLLFLASAVLTMLISICLIGWGVWVYNDLSSFGKPFVLGGILCSVVLFLVAYVGFVAGYFRSRGMLTFNGVLLTLLFILLLIFTVIIFYIGENVDTVDMQTSLEKDWVKEVDQNPGSVCTFQKEFQCSGFLNSCHNKNHAQCPRNCDITNRNNPSPCYPLFVHEIQKNFRPAGIGMLFLLLGVLVGLIINWILCHYTRLRSKKLNDRFAPTPGTGELRSLKTLKSLNSGEEERLQKEFQKIDANGDGKVDKMELQKFYKKAFKQEISNEEVELVLAKVDVDEDGKLDFLEFQALAKGIPLRSQQVVQDPRMSPYDRKEVQQLSEEFFIFRKDAIGTPEVERFYETLYGMPPDPTTMDRALVAIGKNRSDQLDIFDFCALFARKIDVPTPTSSQKGFGSSFRRLSRRMSSSPRKEESNPLRRASNLQP